MCRSIRIRVSNLGLRNVCTMLLHSAVVILSSVASTVTGALSAEPPAHVQEYLRDHCLECHRGDDAEAGFRIDGMAWNHITDVTAQRWASALEAIEFGKMPPPGQVRPDADATRIVGDAIQDRLAEAGFELDIDHRLAHPAYANLLDHDRLFDGSISGPASSPPRIWRLHPEAYDHLLETFGRQLGEGGPLSKPFTVGDGKGIASNYAGLQQADSATLGQLMLNCRQIATYQTVGFRKMKKDNRTKELVERHIVRSPESFAAIMDSTEPLSDRQLSEAVKEEFRLVLSRRPTQDELKRYRDLLRDAIAISDRPLGLQTMAMAVLLRPDSIYRMEIGLGPEDEHGRRMLSSYELAHAIAFALTDSPPNQLLLGEPKPRDRGRKPQPPSLLQLAEQGQLETRQDVREMVQKIWDSDHVNKPRILRFFREFFGYHAAETVFKGDRATRSFAPKFFVKDADDLVMHHVRQDRNVLRELLTTDRYFVQWPGSLEEYDRRVKYITERNNKTTRQDLNYRYFVDRAADGLRPIPQANPSWRQTVRFYNLDEQTWDYPTQQPFEMPKGQRVGMLTHPAWLVAWSGNFENHPIRRGKWIREHLLAGSVPEIPITVNAQVPEDPHKSLRERLSVTREKYCWQCHQKMDPLGLPLEAYTDFGTYRSAEGLGHTRALGKPKETVPVNSRGKIIGSGDDALDGPVSDVRDMMQRLAASERVRQSFVRHAFRFWMGRNETFADSPTLIAADRAYEEGGGSFRALVIELLSSDSFLMRK